MTLTTHQARVAAIRAISAARPAQHIQRGTAPCSSATKGPTMNKNIDPNENVGNGYDDADSGLDLLSEASEQALLKDRDS